MVDELTNSHQEDPNSSSGLNEHRQLGPTFGYVDPREHPSRLLQRVAGVVRDKRVSDEVRYLSAVVAALIARIQSLESELSQVSAKVRRSGCR